MEKGLLFWIVFVVCVLLYGWSSWPLNRASGTGLAVFILLFLLGWQVFGFVVK